MDLRKLAASSIAAGAVALAASGPSVAATFDYDFGVLYAGSGPASGTFAHLSVTTTDYLTFVYDLKVGTNLNAVFGNANTFISRLLVNTASNADPASVGILSGTWGVAQVRLDTSASTAGGLAWDFADNFCGADACNPNSPSSRLVQGEEVKWMTTFTGTQNPPFGMPPFMLKVQGYGSDGGYIATPVPEPQTYATLLAGLGILGFAVRRRRRALVR